MKDKTRNDIRHSLGIAVMLISIVSWVASFLIALAIIGGMADGMLTPFVREPTWMVPAGVIAISLWVSTAAYRTVRHIIWDIIDVFIPRKYDKEPVKHSMEEYAENLRAHVEAIEQLIDELNDYNAPTRKD